ncbi:AraC family transcriptional regulator [Ammoniphilus sp. YIM 78166]|uniref:AraC family transcriptional regulator n=1 Tax=Ammoniphilus sp. YIM 78166 TaxID=1644106 RepID=UPI00106F1C0F|nr:AraC family transcriptional regulator [Ammoniphilus sp. YIM 78166]
MTHSSLSFSTTLLTLLHLSDINSFLLNSAGGVTQAYQRYSLPPFLLEPQAKAFKDLIAEAQNRPGVCFLYTNEFGLTYAAGGFDGRDPDASLFVLGPFLSQMPDLNKLFHQFHLDQATQILLDAFFRSLPLISQKKWQGILNILEQARGIRQAPVHGIDTAEPHKFPSEQHSFEQLHEHDHELINLRYQFSRDMMHAVTKGNKEELRSITEQSRGLFDFTERFPNQPVRAMKNMLIVLNTMLRIAAENGGVPPFYLHVLSEKFAIQIERVDSINALTKLIDTMGDEYCDLVKKRTVLGYSSLVQKVIAYLSVEYNKPLMIQKLAADCAVHPAHLSRQFKKETGLTITHYLQQLRIEEAKWMLRKDRMSIDWIAGAVGFEDAGYFTRVFRKWEGATPTEYRNHWQDY